MLPADQCLGLDDPARGHVDDWLVVQAKLIALQRMAQILLQIQPREAVAVHARVEHDMLTLAAGLGPVHRDIRVAQHGFCIVPVGVAERQADAGRDHNVPPVKRERGAELPGDVFGHDGRIGFADEIVDQHHKFVSA